MTSTTKEINDFMRLWSKEQKSQLATLSESTNKIFENSGIFDISKKMAQSFVIDSKIFEYNYGQFAKRMSTMLQQYNFAEIERLQEQIKSMANNLVKVKIDELLRISNYDFSKIYSNILGDSEVFSQIFDLAYEAAKEKEVDSDIERDELKEQVKEELEIDGIEGLEDSVIKKENNNFINTLKTILLTILLSIIANFIYDFGKVAVGSLIKADTKEDSPTVYEITNQNTYVNVIEKIENNYHIIFLDNNGNVIDGYVDEENIDFDFSEDE